MTHLLVIQPEREKDEVLQNHTVREPGERFGDEFECVSLLDLVAIFINVGLLPAAC